MAYLYTLIKQDALYLDIWIQRFPKKVIASILKMKLKIIRRKVMEKINVQKLKILHTSFVIYKFYKP